ncbi:hypothetical protein ACJX0J_021290, partial [Zea mays]
QGGFQSFARDVIPIGSFIFSLTFLAWISLFIFFITANITQHLKSKELHYALSTLIEEYFVRVTGFYQPYTIHILCREDQQTFCDCYMPQRNAFLCLSICALFFY